MNSLKGTCFDLDAYVPVMNLEGYGKKPSNQPATPGDPMSSDDPKVRMAASASREPNKDGLVTWRVVKKKCEVAA